jgi:phage portal protein BeeE
MAKVWQALFGRGGGDDVEERLSKNEWASYFGFGGNQYPLSLSASTQYDKKEEADHDFQSMVQGIYKKNGIVFACCMARSLLFSEARFQFQAIKQGRPQDLFGTQELEIFENPWPNATTGELLTRAIQDADLAGNFFVVREGKRLRRLRPDWVDIVLTAPPSEALKSDVAGYIYKPGGTEHPEDWEIFPADGSNGKVAHWSPIPDPEQQFRGMTWLTPVLREIEADFLANRHKTAFYKNAATPNIAVSFKETVTNEQFKEFMKAMDRSHVGPDNAYKTMYLGGGADVTPLTIDFQALDFKKIQGAGETRIAAAARVSPVVIGLSEGMQGSSLNAGNFRSARDAFADGTMRPLWRSFCAAMTPLVNVPKASRLWYDDRDIAYLREDIKDLAEIQSQEASTITKLIQDGYTPDSIVEAVMKKDWSLLKHTGLYSVQLQPPMPEGPPTKVVDQNGNTVKQPSSNQGALSKPPNSKPGRPTNQAAGKGPNKDGDHANNPRPYGSKPTAPTPGQKKAAKSAAPKK